MADVKTLRGGSPGARPLRGSPFVWRNTQAHHHLAAPCRPLRGPPLLSPPSPGLRAREAWPPPGVEWRRAGDAAAPAPTGRGAGRGAAGCRTAGAGFSLAGPAAPNTGRAAATALPGWPSPCWSREREGAGPRGQGSAPPWLPWRLEARDAGAMAGTLGPGLDAAWAWPSGGSWDVAEAGRLSEGDGWDILKVGRQALSHREPLQYLKILVMMLTAWLPKRKKGLFGWRDTDTGLQGRIQAMEPENA
ncbi:formin-like protein 18 [Trachypithecus francoisi]|uniref:formin-like protein 18 n=1 Tax=Trachypithecus francoisi TaxID=54180 RepID=UPI00141BA04F|nr:formin-like protein 18 [Trachypithecus francoisi]